MYVLINNKKFSPARVSSSPIRLAKNVHFNKHYYEFNSKSDSYPLELAVMQIKDFDKYEMVFFPDYKLDGYYGVFKETPTRKTIFIEKNYFSKQVIKYKQIFKNIAIVNDTELLNDEIFSRANNGDILENIDFISIEKIPELLDPSKNKILARKLFATFIFIISIHLGFGYYQGEINSELSSTQNRLANSSALFIEANNKLKAKIIPTVPHKDVQLKYLIRSLNDIDNGVLR